MLRTKFIRNPTMWHLPAGLWGGVGMFIFALTALKQSQNKFSSFTVELAQQLLLSPAGEEGPTRK